MLLLQNWSPSVADVHALVQRTTKLNQSPEDIKSSCGKSKSTLVSFHHHMCFLSSMPSYKYSEANIAFWEIRPHYLLEKKAAQKMKMKNY
jgi:hypothetical protein